ncbi:unnamed protein product [marine sediment metagenome]|uniref:Helix-turn-helix domain-containing protein n=1 Tax=marine sediment metagenome TaxID=412755 RepID=X1BJJ2_9ZZZZ
MSKLRKKRGPPEHWVRLDSRTLKGESWQGLSAAAKIFYIQLKSEYYGHNNGKIKLSYTAMKNVKGCCCRYAISKAIKELKAKGWITIKEIGGLHRHYNLYKLTWKYDIFKHD